VLPYAIDASNLCASLAPREIKEAFRESMRDIRKIWEDELKKRQRKKQPDLKKVES
jgi:flavin-dependent dehydrogenase